MRKYIHLLGHACSRMMMNNLGLFIAWGFLSALFSEGGWFPHPAFASMLDPFLRYILPCAVAYQGGCLVDEKRGGIVAVIACMGAICSTETTMLLGAMVIGPLSAWILARWDRCLVRWIPSGFEMLANNLSMGFWGCFLACVNYTFAPGLIDGLFGLLYQGAKQIVSLQLLPLVALVSEPAKVLFLNNALNHGLFTPLGMEQVKGTGMSIFYMIESNPGPGAGVLAYVCLQKKTKEERSEVVQAMIIHLFGGIHEIYFPYVLMNPVLLLALITGSMASIALAQLLEVGLLAPASPGSLFVWLGLARAGKEGFVLLCMVVGAVVSFLCALPFSLSKREKVDKTDFPTSVQTIVFACDSGLGSSAMGAGILQRKLRQHQMRIDVGHKAYDQIDRADIILCHQSLETQVRAHNPGAYVVLIEDFLHAPAYESLIERLKGQYGTNS